MIRLLLVRPEAERDLVEARDWYDRKRTGLGAKFLDEITASMMDLHRYPERNRLYFLSFRRLLVRRFPYKIFYQIIGEHIVAVRVLHVKLENRAD